MTTRDRHDLESFERELNKVRATIDGAKALDKVTP